MYEFYHVRLLNALWTLLGFSKLSPRITKVSDVPIFYPAIGQRPRGGKGAHNSRSHIGTRPGR